MPINGFGGGFGSATGYGLGYGEILRSGSIEQILVINNASHSHAVDSVVITQRHTLAVQDASHAHTVDHITFGAVILLADSATHGHTADNVNITSAHSIVIANTQHSHTADGPIDLWQMQMVWPDSAVHATYVDNVPLVSKQTLEIFGAFHDQLNDKLRIIDWTALGKDFGAYIPRFDEVGALEEAQIDSTGTYIPQTIEKIEG